LGIRGERVDCYVTSEDDEILAIASKFGSKTYKRPPRLSGDRVTLDPVIHNAYKEISRLEGVEYDLVITFQPTSPLISNTTINRAVAYMQESGLDTLISGVYDTHLTWNKEGNTYKPNYKKRVNRQQLPQTYKETGSFVISRSSFVLPESRFGPELEIFPVPKNESIDIDDFEDWNLCEYYLKRKKVLFVVAGNQKIGMGHVYNVLSIANEILSHQLNFLVLPGSELAHEKITEFNYSADLLPRNSNLLEEVKSRNPNVVINDILDTDAAYIEGLRNAGISVINFEDLGSGSQAADLVINAMYPEPSKFTVNHYYGKDYFILRDEFLYTPLRQTADKAKRILLSFGGTDPNNFTRRILDLISQDCIENGLEIEVIVGMGYQLLNDLKGEFPQFNIIQNVHNISEHISQADLVFTSAGRTTFEVASLGVPAIVLCQNEREATHFFASAQNGFYNLGLGSQVTDEDILKAFHESLTFKMRSSMSRLMLRNGLKEGKVHVMKLINEILNSLQ